MLLLVFGRLNVFPLIMFSMGFAASLYWRVTSLSGCDCLNLFQA